MYLLVATQVSQRVRCRCGINSRKKTSPPSKRTYKNTKRCKCVKSQLLCSELCNCHGKCGAKDCGGSPKMNVTKRQGRKRKLHPIQKAKKQPSSKLFLESRTGRVNPGKVNILEYVVVCAIILFLETKNNLAHILDVKKYYDDILHLIRLHDIPLPLNSRSLENLQGAFKKAFAVRKTISLL